MTAGPPLPQPGETVMQVNATPAPASRFSLFEHHLHPHVKARREAGPVKVADQHPAGSRMQRFNARAAVAVTGIVGSMWCAYAFGAFDLISLPAAIRGGVATMVSWVAQTFLQLVLLSVIMVGQSVQAAASDARSAQEFGDVEALLHGQGEQASHLDAQDAKILAILAEIRENTDLTKSLTAGVTASTAVWPVPGKEAP